MSINISVATSTANSYASVNTANNYFDQSETNNPWLNIVANSTGTLSATTRKENLLKQATREIDQNLRFIDNKVYDYAYGDPNRQALEFPRTSCSDYLGNYYIPDEVQFATCEQAIWILERGGKRTSETGAIIVPQTIGDRTKEYLKNWINRSITPYGVAWWRG